MSHLDNLVYKIENRMAIGTKALDIIVMDLRYLAGKEPGASAELRKLARQIEDVVGHLVVASDALDDVAFIVLDDEVPL